MSFAFPSAEALGVAFRPCREEDLPFLARLYASTRLEEVAQTGWPAEVQARFLAQQFDAQHRHYSVRYPDAARFIVERDGEPVGRLYVEELPSALQLIDISLLPEARGAGIGGAILHDLVVHADRRAAGFGLSVLKGNPARRLYERFGFSFVSDQDPYDRLERPGRA